MVLRHSHTPDESYIFQTTCDKCWDDCISRSNSFSDILSDSPWSLKEESIMYCIANSLNWQLFSAFCSHWGQCFTLKKHKWSLRMTTSSSLYTHSHPHIKVTQLWKEAKIHLTNLLDLAIYWWWKLQKSWNSSCVRLLNHGQCNFHWQAGGLWWEGPDQ